MYAPRWRKVIRDLLANKGRTLLVVLAIAVGVFAFGSVFITQEVLLKNIERQYLAGNESTITIYISGFDNSLVSWVNEFPGIADAEGSASQTVKLLLPSGKEEILNLISITDFRKMRLNLLAAQTGYWPPGKNEIVFERNSLTKGTIFLGDKINIKTDSERVYSLNLVGSVYDNSGFPYIFTNQMTGFISWDTLGAIGYPKEFNKLNIKTSPDVKTLDDAERLTFDLTEKLKKRGVRVNGNFILKPNQHWATDNSKAFTAIMSVIGVFSLILSGFLVINTISALLAQHKKQIGIMKAVGANQGQVTTLYLLMVAIYGILSLLLALPIGMLLAYLFLKLVTDFLNLDIGVFYLPWRVFLMELGSALLIPLAAAAIPILQSAKKPLREAIYDYQSNKKTGKIDKILSKISGLSLPMVISLRNVFRKRGRLILTMGTLITAGALFISVINVRTAMYREMDRILSMFDFEVDIELGNDYSKDSIISRVREVAGVAAVEARNHAGGSRIKKDGSNGKALGITGLPPETLFSSPVVLSGRWLIVGDKNNIVLTSGYMRDNRDLVVGDIITLEIEGTKYDFPIVGIIASTESMGFLEFSEVARIKDEPNLASSYLIKTNPPDSVTQERVAADIESKLDRGGILVSQSQTKAQIYASAANQFNFMIFFLLTMALMVAVVGGLGLAGTMSLNVMERTREIGIMRSIGAGDRAISDLVLVEGLFVGFISWVFAVPFSFPLTYGFCYMLGNAFFERILVFSMVPGGIIIWLLIVIVIAIVSSILPSKKASKMSISETLSYE